MKALAAGGAREKEHRERSDRPRSGPNEVPVIRIPENPTACAFMGCTETGNLLEVTTGEGTRVLCPDHVRGWVER